MWRLVDLGPVDGYTMTNLYEAVGHSVSTNESPNTVILNHPIRPFVNIGYHQLMEKEIDIEYAKSQGFELVRRTIGGGAILDGPWEQDYFVIVKRGSIDCPPTILDFYKKFLKPPVKTLRKLGLNAVIRPPNDILVEGRKISGNGAISIENSNVLAGDILLDTPADLMSKIIKVPDEKFQDKVAESMEEWLTSIRKNIGKIERDSLKKIYVDSFKEEIGVQLVPGELTYSEKEMLETLIKQRKKDEWIFGKDNDFKSKIKGPRTTKIRGGVNVTESIYKAGKMIRIILVSEENVVSAISISGDFFTVPYEGAIEKLEKDIIGTRLEMDALKKQIEDSFKTIGLVTMGATQQDFVEAIIKAKPKLD
jgi:lipoate-protein ligase A